MTIEKTLDRIAEASERTAAAIENILGIAKAGSALRTIGAPAQIATETATAKVDKTTKAAAPAPAAPTEPTPPDDFLGDGPAETEITVDEIRKTAQDLQVALSSPEAVRKLLEKNDATPLGAKLKPASQATRKKVLEALKAAFPKK